MKDIKEPADNVHFRLLTTLVHSLVDTDPQEGTPEYDLLDAMSDALHKYEGKYFKIPDPEWITAMKAADQLVGREIIATHAWHALCVSLMKMRQESLDSCDATIPLDQDANVPERIRKGYREAMREQLLNSKS